MCCKIYVSGFVKCQTVILDKVERNAAVPKICILTWNAIVWNECIMNFIINEEIQGINMEIDRCNIENEDVDMCMCVYIYNKQIEVW